MSIRSCTRKLYRRLLCRKESGGPVNQIEYWAPSRMLHKQDGYRHTTVKVTDKPVFHTDAWNCTEPWLPTPKDQRSDFLDPLCDWVGIYDTDEVQEWMKAMGIARQMKAEPEATEADCIAALKAADLDGEVYELEDFLRFYKEMRSILAHRPAEQPHQALVEALADLTDAFLSRHGCFPLDQTNDKERHWHRAMKRAYQLIGQPNTLNRANALLSAPAGDAKPPPDHAKQSLADQAQELGMGYGGLADEQICTCPDCTGAGDDGHGHLCYTCEGSGGVIAATTVHIAALRGQPNLLREPTEAMLNAARDWSAGKYGKPIGSEDATGCWQAMFDAALPGGGE